MGIFNRKQKQVEVKPELDNRSLCETRIRKTLEDLAKKGATPIEMARKAAEMREDFEDDLTLTIEELSTKRSKIYCEQLSKMSEEELSELFNEFFVSRKLNAAKLDGLNDLELDNIRISNETYVTKLMSMSKEERLLEFKRIDNEQLHAAKNANDENVFKYCLSKEIESLKLQGKTTEEIESLKRTRLIEFVVGELHYSKEEFANASLELEYKDLTEGTSYIIDTKHMPSIEQSLCLTKTEMDLQKLVSSKMKK